MKRIYYFAALAALAGVMTSCSSNEDLAGNESPQEIQSANLGIDVKIASEVTSRAATEHGTTWQAEVKEGETVKTEADKIGVSLVESSTVKTDGDYTYYSMPGIDNSSSYYTNIEWTYSSSTPNWSGNNMPLFNTGAKVTAYYPYKSTDGFNPKAIEMKTADNIDWMYQACTGTGTDGETALSATNATATLKMTHAQAEIKLVINNGVLDGSTKKNLYTGAGNITSLTISSDQFTTDATLNSMTGDITKVGSSAVAITETTKKDGKDYVYSIANDASKTTELQNVTDQWFVSPIDETNTSAKVTFNLTIDKQTYKIEVPVYSSGTTGTSITKGKRYKFTLTLSDKNLSISSVTITDWADAGTGTGTLGPTNN